MDDPLLRVAAQIITLSGGVTEPSGGNSLEVLLPSPVAKHLGIPEEATLRASLPDAAFGNGSEEDTREPGHGNDSENESAEPGSRKSVKPRRIHELSYTPETLEKLATLLGPRGMFLERCARRVYLKQEGIEPAVSAHFTPLNGPARVMTSRVQPISYLLCNAHYTALSDERKEGVVETAVNEFTGLPVDDIHSLLRGAETTDDSPPNVRRAQASTIYHALQQSTQDSIERELQQFHHSLQRKLERDFRRVRNYYGSLVGEIEGKIRRRDLRGKDREAELQRIEAIRVEMQKKLIDQRERYAVKINVRWLNVQRLHLEVILATYEIQRKRSTREILLVWNPLKKGFEDLACESCGTPLQSFWMCGEAPHLLCPACYACPQCGKNVCHACHPRKCPRCGDAYPASIATSGSKQPQKDIGNAPLAPFDM